MKLIVFNDVIGHIVKIGVYTDDNKWVKWIPKKDLDKYAEEAYSVEIRNL